MNRLLLMTGRILLLVLVALATVPVKSSAQTTTFYAFGDGVTPCSRLVSAANRDMPRRGNSGQLTVGDTRIGLYLGWIDGLMSGWNAARGAMIGMHSDPEARFQWTLNYCKAHPLDDLAKVASALYIDLSARGM